MGYATPYLPGLRRRRRAHHRVHAGGAGGGQLAAGGTERGSACRRRRAAPPRCDDRPRPRHPQPRNVGEPARAAWEIWRVPRAWRAGAVVVPNWRGIWAWAEKTPLGYGRPFTRGQLTRFSATRCSRRCWSEALAAPPIRRRPWLRTGNTWEQIGVALWGAFAGVIIVEATKQLYQGRPGAGARAAQASLPAGAGATTASALRDRGGSAIRVPADGYSFLRRRQSAKRSFNAMVWLQNSSPSPRSAGRGRSCPRRRRGARYCRAG